MKRVAVLLALLMPSAALAEQAPNPIALQKIIAVVQAQRDAAANAHASAEARILLLVDENAALKAQVTDLEKQVAAAKPADASGAPVPPAVGGTPVPAK